MPALALEVHRVEELLGHLALGERPRALHQAVGEGRLAVVDVGDDREVADVLHGWQLGPERPRIGPRALRAVRAPADLRRILAALGPADHDRVEARAAEEEPAALLVEPPGRVEAEQAVGQDLQGLSGLRPRGLSASGQATRTPTRPLMKARKNSSSSQVLEERPPSPRPRPAPPGGGRAPRRATARSAAAAPSAPSSPRRALQEDAFRIEQAGVAPLARARAGRRAARATSSGAVAFDSNIGRAHYSRAAATIARASRTPCTCLNRQDLRW